MLYVLKASDFILPDGTLKCSAVPTWLINKFYLAKEAVREYTVLYCTILYMAPLGQLQLEP